MDQVIYLQNLPKYVCKKDIMDLFGSDINVSPESIHILNDGVGTPNGYGFVEINEELKESLMHMISNRLFIGSVTVYASMKPKEMMTAELENQFVQPTNFVRINGHLPAATKEEIKDFFCDDVEIEMDKIRLCGSTENGTAYIQLSDSDDVDKICQKHKTYWNDRFLEIYKVSEETYINAEDGKIEDTAAAVTEGVITDYVVSIRGLPFTATEDDIINFMNPLIPTSIKIEAKAGATWRSGCANVYFANEKDADRAVEKNLQYIGSRYIEIKLGSNKFHPGAAGVQGPFVGNSNAMDTFNQGEKTPHGVFMRGLPFQATNSQVAEFFSPHNPVNIELIVQANGYMSGTGIAYFNSSEEASASLDKHLQYMGRRYIELRLTDGRPSGGMLSSNMRSEWGILPVQTMFKPMSAKCSLINNKSILGRLLSVHNMPIVDDVRCYQTSAPVQSARSNVEMVTSETAFKGVLQRLAANFSFSQKVRLIRLLGRRL